MLLHRLTMRATLNVQLVERLALTPPIRTVPSTEATTSPGGISQGPVDQEGSAHGVDPKGSSPAAKPVAVISEGIACRGGIQDTGGQPDAQG